MIPVMLCYPVQSASNFTCMSHSTIVHADFTIPVSKNTFPSSLSLHFCMNTTYKNIFYKILSTAWISAPRKLLSLPTTVILCWRDFGSTGNPTNFWLETSPHSSNSSIFNILGSFMLLDIASPSSIFSSYELFFSPNGGSLTAFATI